MRWRQYCGYRYIPRVTTFKQICNNQVFQQNLEDVVSHIPNPQKPKTVIENRILGGRDVTFRESPWTVQITAFVRGKSVSGVPPKQYFEYHCTGVLITMKHV